MMKGLVSIVAVLSLWAVALTAGSLEVYLGGGPSAASFDEINAVVGRFNAIIAHLNETFDLLPTVKGRVEALDQLGSGIAIQAGEWVWLSDQFACGGKLELFHAATSTIGTYISSKNSEISIDLACTEVGLMVGGRYDFLRAGVILSLELAVGYTYASFSRAITFEVPPEYPLAISGLPLQGGGRYGGFAPAVEAGLALSIPITDWFSVGSSLWTRVLTYGRLADEGGNGLDLDGNGTTEKVDLGGLTVQFTFSFNFDLSREEEKE